MLPAPVIKRATRQWQALLDLPAPAERESILSLHVTRRRPGISLPLGTVVGRTEGYSGAELEQTVIEAMHLAFAERRELNESDLIKAATQLVPLSRTAREQLEALKRWASSGRARAASSSHSPSTRIRPNEEL